MNTKWLDSKEQLLSYVGRKYTVNEVSSLEASVLSLVTMSTPKDLGTKVEFEALTYFEQDLGCLR